MLTYYRTLCPSHHLNNVEETVSILTPNSVACTCGTETKITVSFDYIV